MRQANQSGKDSAFSVWISYEPSSTTYMEDVETNTYTKQVLLSFSDWENMLQIPATYIQEKNTSSRASSVCHLVLLGFPLLKHWVTGWLE